MQSGAKNRIQIYFIFINLWKRCDNMAKDRGLTMHVREFSPIKESLRTWVSLLALNGVWGLLRPRALIHS